MYLHKLLHERILPNMEFAIIFLVCHPEVELVVFPQSDSIRCSGHLESNDHPLRLVPRRTGFSEKEEG